MSTPRSLARSLLPATLLLAPLASSALACGYGRGGSGNPFYFLLAGLPMLAGAVAPAAILSLVIVAGFHAAPKGEGGDELTLF